MKWNEKNEYKQINVYFYADTDIKNITYCTKYSIYYKLTKTFAPTVHPQCITVEKRLFRCDGTDAG